MADASGTREWQAQVVRVTAFALEDIAAPGEEASVGERWWRAIVRDDPANIQYSPKTRIAQIDGQTETGPLCLKIQSSRVDWVFATAVAMEHPEARIPAVGPFKQVSKVLIDDIARRWLNDCPAIARLAFGAIVVLPVEGRLGGYEVLKKYLHAVRFDDGMREFQFRVNRRRESATGIPSLQINRLSKWSVLHYQLFGAAIAPGQTISGAATDRFACRLELDVNTAPDFSGELPRERLGQILEELKSLAEEITERGDIP